MPSERDGSAPSLEALESELPFVYAK